MLEKLASLDDPTQNRSRLALRWYQRSFGDDRLVEIPWKGRLETLSIAGWPWNARRGSTGSYAGGFERMRGRPACSTSGLLWRFTMSWALMGVLCPEAKTSTRTCRGGCPRILL